MAGGIWQATTGGAVALTAATAKTVIAVKSSATGTSVPLLKNYRVSFDGVTASAVPVLIEVCLITFATNAPGTNSTTITPLTSNAEPTAVGFTAAKTWTVEPTVITVMHEFLLTPNGGVIFYDYPLGDELRSLAVGDGVGLRMTAPAAVNTRAALTFGRV